MSTCPTTTLPSPDTALSTPREPAAGSGKYLAALFLGAVLIGFGPIFVRQSEVGPSATAFWRVALALPLLTAWTLASRPKNHRGPETAISGSPVLSGGGSWGLLALGGAFLAADLALWHWAIKLTSVANATLEANFAAVFVPLLGWLLFKERVNRQYLIALALAIGGTILLVGKNAHLSPTTLKGDALGLATALFYSGYILCVKAARDRGIATPRIMAVSGLVTALGLLPIAWISGEGLLPPTAHGWAVLVGLAVLSHFAGQSLITFAMAGLPASMTSLGLLVQPATAAIAAWLILGEGLAPAQMLGGGILLAGLWLAKRRSG
jgi:drug/metabolite transporter (DMT)-like permease